MLHKWPCTVKHAADRVFGITIASSEVDLHSKRAAMPYLTVVFNMYGHALRLWLAVLILFPLIWNADNDWGQRHLFLFPLHRNHNERNRESNTIRHHHRSILYWVRRWNLSRLLFPAIQQYGHVCSCIRAPQCNTCAIFYYLDSAWSNTLNFYRAKDLPECSF